MSGAVGWLAFAPLLMPDLTGVELVAGTALCSGAALFPDIDHPGSSLSRSLGPVTQVASAGMRAVSGGHRQGTHSLLGSIVATAVAAGIVYGAASPTAAAITAFVLVSVSGPLIGRTLGMKTASTVGTAIAAVLGVAIYTHTVALGVWYVAAVGLGWTFHWIGDAFTKAGVPVMWPVSKKRLGLPLFRTGGMVENVATGFFAVAFLGLSATALTG